MYDRGVQKNAINYYVVAFLIALFVYIGTVFLIEATSPQKISQNWATVRLCGYSKAIITVLKYMPQVYLNWKR